MIVTVALRNLIHDRTRLLATVIGLAFAIALMGIQVGAYLGASRLITSMVDHAQAQLWIVPIGTDSFEDGLPTLDHNLRHRVLTVEGVKAVTPLVVEFADWRRPDGALVHVVVVGADLKQGGLLPWNIVEGNPQQLGNAGHVAVDQSYLPDLGLNGLGRGGEIEGLRTQVAALTTGIRSFTQSPYVFSSTESARRFLEVGHRMSTYFLVALDDGVNANAARAAIQARMPEVDVLTSEEFRDRGLDRWLMQTGAGLALIGGLLLGVLIGIIIVAQSTYMSTNDHIMEYAMLRVLGSTSGYLQSIVVAQAVIQWLAGFILGAIGTLLVGWLSASGSLPLALTPAAMILLLLATLLIAVAAAAGGLWRVTHVDPGIVFTR